MNPIPDTIWIVKGKMLKPDVEQVWAVDFLLPGAPVAERIIAKQSDVPAVVARVMKGEYEPTPIPATPPTQPNRP